MGIRGAPTIALQGYKKSPSPNNHLERLTYAAIELDERNWGSIRFDQALISTDNDIHEKE